MGDYAVKTIACSICGDIIMHDFLDTHMQYVHPIEEKRIEDKQIQAIKLQLSETRNTRNKIDKKRKSKKAKKKTLNIKVTSSKTPKSRRINKSCHKPALLFKYIPPLKCILCGATIKSGTLEQHKRAAHNETSSLTTTSRRTYKNQWVRIVQGGAPGLGKR